MTIAGAVILWGCWIVPVLALALVLKLTGQTELHWKWFAAAAVAYGIYMLVGFSTLPANLASLPDEARWSSRLFQIAATATMMALAWNRHPLLTARGMALTVRQNPGSIRWSLLGMAALTAAGMIRNGVDPALTKLPANWLGWLYHAVLPGLEPEPIYRGLMLSLFAVALGGTKKAIGWGAVMSTMVFSLGHGFYPYHGKIGFDLHMLIYAAAAGTILVAMRLRSGSLLFGILGHNLIDFTERLA